jgi:nucleoside diphosphate kinase
MDRAFLLIKPDGLSREEEIRAILLHSLAVVSERAFDPVPMERIEALYAEHRGKEFHPWLLDFFRGRPAKAMILELKPDRDDGLYDTLSRLVGETNPKLAAPGTVRALSDDDMELSFEERRVVRNLVHRCRTREESLREGALFFYDRPGPGVDGMAAGPAAVELVSPLGEKSGGDPVVGIFFEERLADILSKRGIIPPDWQLVGLRETAESHGEARLAMTFLEDGRKIRKEALIRRSSRGSTELSVI